MMKVFGRDGSHRYEAAITEWLRSNDPEQICLALNLQHEDRVSPEREREFDAFVASAEPSGAELRDALVNYFYERVRSAGAPDYRNQAINGNNFVAVTGGESSLARVVDLTSLDSVFVWAKAQRREFFKTYPNGDAFRWLQERLHAPYRQAFLTAILEVLVDHSRNVVFQPAWATTWKGIEAIRTGERLLQALGIRKLSTEPRWLLLLRYSTRDIDLLVRPTQLDAGLNPCHFPSPACAPCGHPMDLCPHPPAERLLPEYIHDQIAHSIAHSDSVWPSSPDGLGSLKEQREAHCRLLRAEYPNDTHEWRAWSSGAS